VPIHHDKHGRLAALAVRGTLKRHCWAISHGRPTMWPMARDKKEWFAETGLAFTCTQCGNCCTGPPGYVWFTDEEGRAMAEFLGVEHREFLRRFARKVNGRWTLNEQWNEVVGGYDCVFLRRDENGKALCGVYQHRPTQCRTWPFWPENLKTHRAWARTAEHCPGANNGRLYKVEEIRIIRDSNPWSK